MNPFLFPLGMISPAGPLQILNLSKQLGENECSLKKNRRKKSTKPHPNECGLVVCGATDLSVPHMAHSDGPRAAALQHRGVF